MAKLSWFVCRLEAETNLHFFNTNPDKILVVNYVTVLVKHFEGVQRIVVQALRFAQNSSLKVAALGVLP